MEINHSVSGAVNVVILGKRLFSDKTEIEPLSVSLFLRERK